MHALTFTYSAGHLNGCPAIFSQSGFSFQYYCRNATSHTNITFDDDEFPRLLDEPGYSPFRCQCSRFSTTLQQFTSLIDSLLAARAQSRLVAYRASGRSRILFILPAEDRQVPAGSSDHAPDNVIVLNTLTPLNRIRLTLSATTSIALAVSGGPADPKFYAGAARPTTSWTVFVRITDSRRARG